MRADLGKESNMAMNFIEQTNRLLLERGMVGISRRQQKCEQV